MKWHTLSFEVAEKKMIYNIYHRRPYHFHRNSGGPFTIQPNDDNLVEESSLSSFFLFPFTLSIPLIFNFYFYWNAFALSMMYSADVSVSNIAKLLQSENLSYLKNSY